MDGARWRLQLNGAGRDGPLAGLSGNRRDPVEVGVVVQDGEVAGLGGGGDQQVGHLAAPLMSARKQTLDLPRTAHVLGGRLHQLEDLHRLRKAIPLGLVARRIADLQIADPRACELAPLRSRLYRLADRGLTQASQDAGVEQMGQRHACSRGARSAEASTSRHSFTSAL